jgi:hypothetical protein
MVEGDGDPAAGCPEPQSTLGDGMAGHLLEAQALRAELEICGLTVTGADLVLDRDQDAVGGDLDGVGSTGESK